MIALVTLIIFTGAVIQSALGFGATMITMGFLPLIGAGAAGLGAGSFLGLLIHDRIPADRFGRVIYAFVGIGGFWIIVTHLTGI